MRSGASIDAIERVYRERGRDFYRLALARLGHEEPARDAVQEGFARAIRARRGYRGLGSLEAWLARCVLNAASDLRLPETAAEATADAAVWPSSPDHDLRARLRELPVRQREAVFLRFYLDFDYAQIAETLEIEVGTVSATLAAARARLQKDLSEVRR